jgi:hypothetical protein
MIFITKASQFQGYGQEILVSEDEFQSMLGGDNKLQTFGWADLGSPTTTSTLGWVKGDRVCAQPICIAGLFYLLLLLAKLSYSSLIQAFDSDLFTKKLKKGTINSRRLDKPRPELGRVHAFHPIISK